jgi:hypothetical protein
MYWCVRLGSRFPTISCTIDFGWMLWQTDRQTYKVTEWKTYNDQSNMCITPSVMHMGGGMLMFVSLPISCFCQARKYKLLNDKADLTRNTFYGTWVSWPFFHLGTFLGGDFFPPQQLQFPFKLVDTLTYRYFTLNTSLLNLTPHIPCPIFSSLHPSPHSSFAPATESKFARLLHQWANKHCDLIPIALLKDCVFIPTITSIINHYLTSGL